MLNNLEGKQIKFITGDYENEIGIFLKIVGYSDDGREYCEVITPDNIIRDYLSSSFIFLNNYDQLIWENDAYSGSLEFYG